MLVSLVNLNEPGDYETARRRPAPEVIVTGFGTVCAATVGAAAEAAGMAVDGGLNLNGARVRDAHVPLVDGGIVALARV
jgi:molybdopterin-guanine dinucleotide biosynthesis protein A